MEFTIINNPAFQQIIRQVQENGLHKMGEHLHGEDFSLKTAIQHLATQQIYNDLKQQKIASGLKSLNQIDAFKKKASMFRMTERGVERILPEVAKAVESKLPQELVAARGGVEGFPAALKSKKPWTKQTISGVEELPAMRQLPSEPSAEALRPLFT